MGLTRKVARLAVCLATGLALALTGSVAASAAPAAADPATWTLTDVHQRLCARATAGNPGAYFWVVLDGTWSNPITASIRNLPPGSTADRVVIESGSGDGSSVTNIVLTEIRSAPPGVYTAELWATDGVTTQSVPVRIYLLAPGEKCPWV